jgi:hypothetical protein
MTTLEQIHAALPAFFAAATRDYNRMGSAGDYQIKVKDGSTTAKYLPIVSRSFGGTFGAHSFIVLADMTVKSDSGKPLNLKAGDILKAAGWKKPALNFARGSVFEPEKFGTAALWTGAQ